MKTRNVYQAFIARNSFFNPALAWDNLFTYKNLEFTTDECGLVEDICKALAEVTERAKVTEYINGLIERGGLKYLHCSAQHITDCVLPRIAQMHRMAANLENQEHGKWREHIKVVSHEYTTLSVNHAVLKEMLTAHQPKPVSGKR